MDPREHREHNDHVYVYTFPVSRHTQIMHHLREVLNLQNSVFMVLVLVGSILEHKETSEVHLFWASSNSALFNDPITVTSHSQYKTVLNKAHDIISDVEWMKRPDTNWVFRRLAYTCVYIYKYDWPLRNCAHLELPEYLLTNQHIFNCLKRFETSHCRCNNLCFFEHWPFSFNSSIKILFQAHTDSHKNHLLRLPKSCLNYTAPTGVMGRHR